ncbi:MAG: hypothetical protein V1645_03205 [archaeon]
MKKILLVIAILVVATFSVAAKQQCTTIQDGGLVDSAGNPISVGYDQFGYNYQAHMFNGRYCDYDRVIGGDFCDVNLMMKWNDAWLSNKDCSGDGKLDRHYGFDSYIGSGAWLTNHDTGVNEDGSTWTYFVKIIAVPADATLREGSEGGVWYAADGTEIGPEIWGQFAVIQQVVTGNPPASFIAYDGWPLPGDYKSPAGPGLGNL